MKIVLHPAAEKDIHEAAAFYERAGSPALAARFVVEFKRIAALLVERPENRFTAFAGAPRLPHECLPAYGDLPGWR